MVLNAKVMLKIKTMNPREVLNTTPKGRDMVLNIDAVKNSQEMDHDLRTAMLTLLVSHYYGNINPSKRLKTFLAKAICEEFPGLGEQSKWYNEAEDEGFIESFLRFRRRTCLKGVL